MMTMPAAYEHEAAGAGAGEGAGLDPRVTDFYDYYAGVQEAWDGPALVAFADGRHLGACVDRNGLRPARYARTRSGLLALASEAGAVDLPGEDIVEKGRLGPGQMIAVDLENGRLLRDDVVKTSVASRRPYGAWLLAQRRSLAPQPFDVGAEDGGEDGGGDAASAAARPQPPGPPPRGRPGSPAAGPCEPGDLLRRQAAAGFTAEDVELIVRPMARQAKEPRFSMGNDAPLPILSGKPHVLYDYFTERFAQVTNPAIDPLRERLVMSLAVKLGPRGDLLTAEPEHARQVELPSPVVNKAEMAALQELGLTTARVSTSYEVASGPWGLREAVERVCREAAAAVRDGAEVIVLSDRISSVTPGASHVPPLLAVGAVHHDLIRRGLRSRASLVSETAQCWSVHHFACLIGYGASAVHPYLAFETVRDLWERGRLGDGAPAAGRPPASRPPERPGAPVAGDGAPTGPADLEEALRHYRISAEQGLLKILSKMGISLLASYHGAQLFEAVGLGPDLIEMGFLGTPSRIGGLSVEELAQETVWIHQQAFPELSVEKLTNYGFVRYRPRGEYHLNNPEAAKTLRRACVEGLPDLYRSYSEKLSQRPPTVLRDLLRLVGDGEAGAPAARPARTPRPRTPSSPSPPSSRASAPAACRWARCRARRTRPSPSPWRASTAAPTRARAARTPPATSPSTTSARTASRRASRICRGSRTATGPPRRSARSPPGASASRRPTWPAPTSSRSRSPRAPSRARAASCPATRSLRTSPGCAAPLPASRSSRRRRTTTSTRSRTWRSSSTTCAWSIRAPASR